MLEIRPCEPEDLPAVLGLMEELAVVAGGAADLTLDAMSRLLAEMNRSPATYLNLVAVLDGQAVAFVSAVFYRTLFHRGGTALINELIVTRRQRGQGIGRALVEHVRAEALARGMDELEVGTEFENEAARRFYRQMGFDQEYLLLGMEF